MAHTHTRLLVHVVFSTKQRASALSPEMLARLPAFIAGVARNEGAVVLAANGVSDHMHLLLSIPANRGVSELVRDIKANSSRWIHESFGDAHAFAWQSGYGAFSVSESNLVAVREYIERQPEHHRRVSFQDEYLGFLRRHNVEFDPRWVFSD